MSQRILVIDDEPAVYKLVKALLEKAEYKVTAVASAEEGLRFLANMPFDGIVTDAMMPGMDGFEFTKRVRNHKDFKTIPIIMLTRRRARNDVKQAVAAGVTDYILKPIDEHLLLDKISLHLSGDGKLGKDRHMQEIDLHDDDLSDAKLSYEIEIASISESGVRVRSKFALPRNVPFSIKTALFEEIGIETPELSASASDTGTDGKGFETSLAFAGLEERDLKKIRSWIQRQAIRRKK